MTCKIKECVSYTYQTKSLNLHKMQVGTLFYRFVSEAICIHRDRIADAIQLAVCVNR